MPIVKCAAIECKHNKNSVCTAKKISLSHGLMHTVRQGRQHVWRCGRYELSDEAKRAQELLAKITGELLEGN